MISLTLVKNSNCSHGTVGKKTGFWSGRYGFEPRPLLTFFNFIETTANHFTPLLCMKIFRYQKIIETQEVSSTKSFGTVRQKIFEGIPWFPPPPMHKIFPYLKFSETIKGSHTNFLIRLRQKNSNEKSWYTPPLLSLEFCDSRIFLMHRRVPPRNFSVLWDNKNFWQITVISFFMHKIFLIHEIFWNNGRCRYEFFGTETWIFQREVLILIFPLLSFKFFDSRNFLNHRRVLLRSVLVLWNKKFRRKIMIHPPLIHENFR